MTINANKTKIEMEKRKINLFAHKGLLCIIITIITVMTSCVQGDLYELYEDDKLVLDGLVKKNKWSDDVLLGNTNSFDGKAVFYNTECAAFALSYYHSGGKLEGDNSDCIDNIIKLDAVRALMNWDDEDYSFAYNPDRNYQYKTTIMDNSGGASTQNQMIPAIQRLFKKTFVAQENATIYMGKMLSNGVLKEGMYYIVTTGHVSVPYSYNSSTGEFSCYDCDGSNFIVSVNNIKAVLVENNQ